MKGAIPKTTTPVASTAAAFLYKPLTRAQLGQIRHYAAYKPVREIPILNRPIGQPNPPSVTDNTGIDTRTREEKKADFVNYDRHLARRKELTAEIAKSQYEDVYKFRDTAGKMFVSPGAYFKREKSLYFPNFVGKTLSESTSALPGPAATTAILKGNISLVRIFSNMTGEAQTASYFLDGETPETVVEDGFQVVDINLPDNFATEFLVKWHAKKIRATLPDPARHARYFISRKGVSKEMRQDLYMENKYSGYLYLVDDECKIRWAACGDASESERNALWRFVAALKKEVKQ